MARQRGRPRQHLRPRPAPSGAAPAGRRLERAGRRRTPVVRSSSSRTTPAPPELVGVHLTAAGLRTVAVRTGEEGLAAIRALRPTAVVLDIHLPGMDGWDVLSVLKGDPQLASTPVVVVSVLPERGRGFALGASDYLVKPVSKEGLLGAVWRAVAERVDQSARGATSSSSTTTRPRSSWSGRPWSRTGGPCTTCTGGAEAMLRHPLAAPVGRARRPADARHRRVRGHRRAARGPAHHGDPGRRPDGEVADGAGPAAG